MPFASTVKGESHEGLLAEVGGLGGARRVAPDALEAGTGCSAAARGGVTAIGGIEAAATTAALSVVEATREVLDGVAVTIGKLTSVGLASRA
jgi:hypothetical protein